MVLDNPDKYQPGLSLSIIPPRSMIKYAGPTSACKICGERSSIFDVVDYFKYCARGNEYSYGLSGIPVYYYRCDACGFVFSSFSDDWNDRDYSKYIYNEEYIKIDGDYDVVRPTYMAGKVAQYFFGHYDIALLDYGSGSGKMAEILKSSGFTNVDCYDPFSTPLRPTRKFDAITCFEVIEHTPNPHETLRDIKSFLKEPGIVVFSTALQPLDIETLRASWWYVAPRNGHISIFNVRSLGYLAAMAGLSLRHGVDFHAFVSHTIDAAPLVSDVLQHMELS